MPIRAHCTICSDFFDNARDVAAVPCGHTFHRACLFQWFDTAPSRTCPQCRIQVSKRHIISKLFFDVALEEQTALDAETLQPGSLLKQNQISIQLLLLHWVSKLLSVVVWECDFRAFAKTHVRKSAEFSDLLQVSVA